MKMRGKTRRRGAEGCRRDVGNNTDKGEKKENKLDRGGGGMTQTHRQKAKRQQ